MFLGVYFLLLLIILLSKEEWKKNWVTWKMLAVPFYDVYWLGNGFVGGVNRLRHVSDYGVRQRLMMRDAVYEAVGDMNLDFIMHGGDMPTDGQRARDWAQFIEENKIKPPKKVLDLGCGNGKNAKWLVERGFEVYGVDFSESAIKFARRNVKGA